jgi:DNA-binding response OmpR family regulator
MAEPRVLIIEDQDALRVLLFAVLRHQPLAVDTAATAADALEKVRTCDYALILIDMHLPDNESNQFLNSFRSEKPEATTFIIAVRDPRAEVDLDAGRVNAVLNKPLEIDTLAEVVRECAVVVPPPASGSLSCPPAESEIRERIEQGGSMLTN